MSTIFSKCPANCNFRKTILLSNHVWHLTEIDNALVRSKWTMSRKTKPQSGGEETKL